MPERKGKLRHHRCHPEPVTVAAAGSAARLCPGGDLLKPRNPSYCFHCYLGRGQEEESSLAQEQYFADVKLVSTKVEKFLLCTEIWIFLTYSISSSPLRSH